jgi:putative ABC transport system permease protein
VDAVFGVRFRRIDYNNRIVLLLALDLAALDTAPDRALARNLARHPRLRERGTALVSENFAALHGVYPGRELVIHGKDGLLRLQVLGTAVDYTWNRGTILIDRSWYRQAFEDDLVDVYDLFVHPGRDVKQVRKAIEQRWGKQDILFTLTREEVNREVAGQLRRVYSLAYAQQVVVGLVALLGVIGALFISVLQRRRELGLLRAVGATRAQVLRSVLTEATLMSLVGGVVGFLIGLVMEWYVVRVLLLDEAGFTFAVRIPWLAAGVVFGLSVLLATLVGLWPAWYATRLRITEAIAYE